MSTSSAASKHPHYETLQKASALARASGSTFVLGVGGGSVIDAAKFLASMIATGLEDPWDRLVKEGETIKAVPNGAILTLPATGSESNPVSVISSSTRCPPTYGTLRGMRIGLLANASHLIRLLGKGPFPDIGQLKQYDFLDCRRNQDITLTVDHIDDNVASGTANGKVCRSLADP